jgi:hypothetical protein
VRNIRNRRLKGFGTVEPPTDGIDRPLACADHIAQLFDDRDSLAVSLSSFVSEGLRSGETVVLVISSGHWTLTARRLAALGGDVDSYLDGGQLMVLDAAETLSRFWRRGRPDRDLFDASVGVLIRGLAARGTPFRVYGEMVDLLAGEGDFAGVEQLEELWNHLGADATFTLFCGYMAANFGDSRTAGSLRTICRLHSHVRADPIDTLGSFLLERAG